MPNEVLIDDFHTTLAAPLALATGAGATCTLSDALPASVVGLNARFRVGSEFVLATVTDPTTLTLVARAAEAADRYPAADWPAGTDVDPVLTAAGLDAILGQQDSPLPVGGTPGQYLRKQSATDFDTAWSTLAAADLPATVVYTSANNVFTGDNQFTGDNGFSGTQTFGSLGPNQPAIQVIPAIGGPSQKWLNVNFQTVATMSGGGDLTAYSFAGNGSGLTNLNADNLASGTVDAARLPATVAYLDAAQTWTQPQTFRSGLSSPGAGVSSEQIGAGAIASADFALAIGTGHATVNGAVVIGPSTASAAGSFVAGNNCTATGTGQIAIGNSCTAATGLVLGSFAVSNGGLFAAGQNVQALHAASVIIGVAGGPAAATASAREFVFHADGINGTSQYVLSSDSGYQTHRQMVRLRAEWVNSTDATRASRALLQVTDYTGVWRSGFAIEAEPAGVGVKVGFFGAAAAAKPTITGSRGGNAALASLLVGLAALGLITDSTTV